ncbi:YbaB/EbfC family nucleoid-associated protein [Saccharopolyspora sp. MS10]|uniref:YbaB/EbfC family nucleoid-associated protein n=1 Tax=Saccharopolyspora sp. MS10 TaxID=3385973 RepID=UPI0039A35BE6
MIGRRKFGCRRGSERAEPEVRDEAFRGQDPEGIVVVSVTGLGEVRAVELATDWKRRTDPRRLSTHVLSAANDATLRAASAQAEISEAAPMPPEPVGTLDGLGDKWGNPTTVSI